MDTNCFCGLPGPQLEVKANGEAVGIAVDAVIGIAEQNSDGSLIVQDGLAMAAGGIAGFGLVVISSVTRAAGRPMMRLSTPSL